ncbi:DUF4249 family protein [soil metagenome]
MKRFNLPLIYFVLLSLSGCNIYEQDEYRELVVLEAYAIANRELPDVRLSRTIPVMAEYNFPNAALTEAIVSMTHLDENGSEIQTFNYRQQSAGVYRPLNREYRVEAGHTYQLDVTFNDRTEILQSQTTVPHQFEILSDVAESYVYQTDDQLEILLTATESNARQNIYVFNTLTLEPAIDNLTPFYRSAVVDGDSQISEFFNNSSGLINEGNFEIREDQTILLRFPWIGVAFYGENAVVTNSVDQYLADLVRSQQLQLGGSTLPPGEIPNLIYNVEGGIGVFGSIATDTVITRFAHPIP